MAMGGDADNPVARRRLRAVPRSATDFYLARPHFVAKRPSGRIGAADRGLYAFTAAYISDGIQLPSALEREVGRRPSGVGGSRAAFG